MLRKVMLLFPVVATTLAGMAIVAVLTAGQDTLAPLVIAAIAGFAAAIPASWLVARQLP